MTGCPQQRGCSPAVSHLAPCPWVCWVLSWVLSSHFSDRVFLRGEALHIQGLLGRPSWLGLVWLVWTLVWPQWAASSWRCCIDLWFWGDPQKVRCALRHIPKTSELGLACGWRWGNPVLQDLPPCLISHHAGPPA